MQSRRLSLIEAATNIVVGFVIAYATQVAVFPLFGLHADHATHLAIVWIFTVVSFIRSYVLRRLFNRIRAA